jgi:hypothetical protein
LPFPATAVFFAAVFFAAGFFAAGFFAAVFLAAGFAGAAAAAPPAGGVTSAAGTEPARRDAVLLLEAGFRLAAVPRFLRVSLMIDCLDLNLGLGRTRAPTNQSDANIGTFQGALAFAPSRRWQFRKTLAL